MLSALLLIAAAPNTVESRLGVCIHLTDSTPAEFPDVRKAGFGAVRTDLPWAEIEGQRGTYRWEKFDRAAQGLKAAGLHPLFILFGPNPAYGDESPRTPEARAAFARFSGLAAARYKSYGADFEIWNEPNHRNFWRPEPNARNYVALVKAVSAAVRAADPKARLLGGVTTEPLFPFLEACLGLGLLDSIDTVSIHPYRPERPESLLGTVSRLRALIAASDKGRKIGIEFTEMGYPLTYPGQDEGRRARYITRAFLASLVAGVDRTYIYQWRDSTNATEHDRGWGIQDADLNPLLAYTSLKGLVSKLEGFVFAGRQATASPEDFKLLFTRGAEKRYVVWTARRDPADRAAVGRDPGLLSLASPAYLAVGGKSVMLSGTPQVIAP